jgi:hypothetical protein
MSQQAQKIPVVEGGPAERGEPNELVPGVGELEAIPEHSRKETSSSRRLYFFFFLAETRYLPQFSQT